LPNYLYDVSIEVISQWGNRELKQAIKNPSGNIEFQGINFKPGIYLICLKQNNKIIETQKIIKPQ
jgi:hypothetical protein